MNISRKLYILFSVSVLAAITQIIGCTNTIDGVTNVNIVPTVEFVNVPPENQSFSQNPEINWVGKDIDGQIVMFRFAVITEDEIIAALGGGLTSPLSDTDVRSFVDNILGTMSDTIWTELLVDQQGGDPQTSNIIPMKAELSDPVNTFVAQFVFVEAIDEEDGRSIIAFRRFLRNDNPPNTFITNFDPNRTYINSVVSTSFATGVRIRWRGIDPIDFPSDVPPFEFEWRLYGPYISDTTASGPGSLEQVLSQFAKLVFVTSDAKVFEFGTGARFPICRDVVDTINGGLIEVCDTVLVDTIQESNSLGVIDTLFDVDDPAFVNDTIIFNIIAEQSFDGIDEWTTDTRDSLFNLFKDNDTPNTITRQFIFWVRARDDAKVPDLTPAFTPFEVVNPKFERDIALIDVMLGATVNAAIRDSARMYWRDAIATFGGTDYQDSVINAADTENDYLIVSQSSGNVLPLEFILGHKALIIMGDDTKPGVLKPVMPILATAINAGLNVWLAMRNPMSGGEGAPPEIPIGNLDPVYFGFFGVQQLVYSGWDWYARANFPFQRMEDFSGATSLKTSVWPHLTIDSARLFDRYKWSQHSFPNRGVFPFVGVGPDSNQFALPEVNWMVRLPGTEPMYLYKSIYGPEHPLGLAHSFDGRPVMIRFNTGLFRTAHSLFTPMAFEPDSMQVLVNDMLGWMLQGQFNADSPPPDGIRYPDARNTSASIARVKEYWRQIEIESEFLEPITYGVKNIKNRR